MQLDCKSLCVAVTTLRRSARPGGGAADLSETGMFDLVEIPFFFFWSLTQQRAQEQRGGTKPRLINIDKEGDGRKGC